MKTLITGASSGMGYFFAIELAKRGHDLVVVARRKEKLEELKSRIEKEYKTKVEIVKLDLTEDGAISKLKPYAKKVDNIINNAGFGLMNRVGNHDEDKIRSMMRLNLEVLTLLTYDFASEFKKKGHGRVINISSMGAFVKSWPSMAPYTAGKLYVRRFSRGVRHDLELSKSKVKVQTVMPGAIATEFYQVASGADIPESAGLKPTPSDKFAKVTISRLFDKNQKEVVYGKMAKMAKWMNRLLPSKQIARMFTRMGDQL